MLARSRFSVLRVSRVVGAYGGLLYLFLGRDQSGGAISNGPSYTVFATDAAKDVFGQVSAVWPFFPGGLVLAFDGVGCRRNFRLKFTFHILRDRSMSDRMATSRCKANKDGRVPWFSTALGESSRDTVCHNRSFCIFGPMPGGKGRVFLYEDPSRPFYPIYRPLTIAQRESGVL